jgi:hypothetical protein
VPSVKRAGNSTCPAQPRDDDPAVLERLAERLQRNASELRQLVEEQDAVMHEGAFMYLEALKTR